MLRFYLIEHANLQVAVMLTPGSDEYKVVDSSSLSNSLFVEDHHDAKDIGHDI